MLDFRQIEKVFVTGGCGFIGSNFIRYLKLHYPEVKVFNLDKLTYAGNPENLLGIDSGYYCFKRGDITVTEDVAEFAEQADLIVNFAAETHVDRSLCQAGEFVKTDVYGVFVLLEAARRNKRLKKFIQISTDEVYGSKQEGFSGEEDGLFPSSPYSASKAGGDRLAYSYYVSYGLPVIILRPANNYGPYQYPEKLIPFFILRGLQKKKLPLYGNGNNQRDWLYVEDMVKAIEVIVERGRTGEVYNVGSGNFCSNLQVTREIIRRLGLSEEYIVFVADRPGHDYRYALNCEKIKELGWNARTCFENGLQKTIDWYLNNRWWWEKIIQSTDYRSYVERRYGKDLD